MQSGRLAHRWKTRGLESPPDCA